MKKTFTTSAGCTVTGKLFKNPTPSLEPMSFTPSHARLPPRVCPKGVSSRRRKPTLKPSSHFHFFASSNMSMLERKR